MQPEPIQDKPRVESVTNIRSDYRGPHPRRSGHWDASLCGRAHASPSPTWGTVLTDSTRVILGAEGPGARGQKTGPVARSVKEPRSSWMCGRSEVS